MSRVTPQQVDWLLYNLPGLKAVVEAMEPPVSRSIVTRPATQTPAEPGGVVQSLAVRRASISTVVDAVERGLRFLAPEHQRLYRLKYRNLAPRRVIAKKAFLSERSVSRHLGTIRATIALHVGQIPDEMLAHFWREIGTVLAPGVAHLCYNPQQEKLSNGGALKGVF